MPFYPPLPHNKLINNPFLQITMKVNVGSKNEVKVQAVRETIGNYNCFANAEVAGVDTHSKVSEQPKSLDETVNGAMNRAREAYRDCEYSFGLESGLMQVPNSKTGYMNVCACIIYDGQNYHLGLSSAFEYPQEITRLVFEEGLDVNQACYKTGLSKNPKVGSAEGAIGILTHGRLLRKDLIKQAIMMALIQVENK